MFVKICGITNEEDALLAVAMGADALGFVFAPSPRQVAVQRVHDITRRLPSGTLTVGVFRDEHPSRVIEMVDAAGLSAAQLHGHETPHDVATVMTRVRTVIKAVAAGSVDASRADEFPTGHILVDAAEPGSGRVFDWDLLGALPAVNRLILAGGLTPDNVAGAVAATRPWGVDVSGGVERSPGLKDPVLLRKFITAARSGEPAETERGTGGPFDWMED